MGFGVTVMVGPDFSDILRFFGKDASVLRMTLQTKTEPPRTQQVSAISQLAQSSAAIAKDSEKATHVNYSSYYST